MSPLSGAISSVELTVQLLVSVLTTLGGYIMATVILLCLAAVTLVTEFWWIEAVYRHFPILASDSSSTVAPTSEGLSPPTSGSQPGVVAWLKREKADWAEFARLPIFYSTPPCGEDHLCTPSTPDRR